MSRISAFIKETRGKHLGIMIARQVLRPLRTEGHKGSEENNRSKRLTGASAEHALSQARWACSQGAAGVQTAHVPWLTAARRSGSVRLPGGVGRGSATSERARRAL